MATKKILLNLQPQQAQDELLVLAKMVYYARINQVQWETHFGSAWKQKKQLWEAKIDEWIAKNIITLNLYKMDTNTKASIQQHLQSFASQTTLLSLATAKFLEDYESKSAEDIYKYIVQIKEMIKDNPEMIHQKLGNQAYHYFNTFQLPTDFAPTEDEGNE
jgi:hypothetical protein